MKRYHRTRRVDKEFLKEGLKIYGLVILWAVVGFLATIYFYRR